MEEVFELSIQKIKSLPIFVSKSCIPLIFDVSKLFKFNDNKDLHP